MTDEEMAEEYKESKRHKCFRTDVGKIQIEYEAYLNNLKEAFLAGLKVGRPQWHDLKENPEDLPKEFDINKNRWEMEKRITEHIVQNQDGERVCCLNEKWYYEEGGEAYVIAWCEIPTFDKE